MKSISLIFLFFCFSASASDMFFTEDEEVSAFSYNTRCWAYAEMAGAKRSLINYYKNQANKEEFDSYKEGLNVGYASGFVKSGAVLLEMSKKEAAKLVLASTCNRKRQ